MKNVSFALRKIIRLVLLVLISSMVLFAQGKNYSVNEGLPTIKNYPEEIQSFDSIKTYYFNNCFESKNKMKLKKDIPDEFIKEFAGYLTDFYIQYTNLEKKGFKYQYMKESYGIGVEMMNKLYNLPYPWNIMMLTQGFALAKIVDDRKMPKKNGLHPPNAAFEYVLEALVIEDIFNSHKADTIYIRHNEPIIEKYSEYSEMYILISFKPGGTIQRADSVQNIYVIGGNNEFMFVENDKIYDPNNIIKENNKGYIKFKEDLYSVLPKNSKLRKQK
ncbi:MAG: hypothetical protein PHX07_08315 [Candidatus Marinimicrobia bacterium]|jgi:hypothetical protein|nr:hypothetical protein [Candidatus Neomarinimicrobiota bacterium]MDD4962224.1 hypothetical protein [Candidatus Neomarinimicrobiota bacterium]MDD5709459.1 hypothetical protein [Candidatus Neomarinimicrobiota bacterium]